jgi:hypothetical protein
MPTTSTILFCVMYNFFTRLAVRDKTDIPQFLFELHVNKELHYTFLSDNKIHSVTFMRASYTSVCLCKLIIRTDKHEFPPYVSFVYFALKNALKHACVHPCVTHTRLLNFSPTKSLTFCIAEPFI